MIVLALFNGIPLCPTQNKQLTAARGRFIKSDLARKFDAQLELYHYKNKKTIEQESIIAQSIAKNGGILKLDLHFGFHKESLFTAKNEVRANDVNNRIKATVDGICKMLGIDDGLFFDHHITKLIVPNNEPESVSARLCAISPKEYGILFPIKGRILGEKKNEQRRSKSICTTNRPGTSYWKRR